jgi:hypothetical protein
MMDCRQALQILDFDGSDGSGLPSEIDSAAERAAAEVHLESCPACARMVRNRREVDRTIGQVMRAVPVPRGAQQRLVARLSELETAESGTEAAELTAPLTMVPVAALNGAHSDGQEAARNGQPSPAAMSSVSPAPAGPGNVTGLASRRRFLKRLAPLAACLVVALIGFFGVVWLFTPRWTVDEVSTALSEIDFERLENLANFKGNDAELRLPSDPGWERLCGSRAKGLPLAPNVIAVYGFDVPKTRRSGAVRGLIAVIPLNRIRNPPTADSLATASPTSGYVQARIGESVWVAWRQGDVVCVCLIRGGADSLSTLQGLLEQPSA